MLQKGYPRNGSSFFFFLPTLALIHLRSTVATSGTTQCQNDPLKIASDFRFSLHQRIGSNDWRQSSHMWLRSWLLQMPCEGRTCVPWLSKIMPMASKGC